MDGKTLVGGNPLRPLGNGRFVAGRGARVVELHDKAIDVTDGNARTHRYVLAPPPRTDALFAGRYQNAEISADWTVVAHDGKLFMTGDRLGEIELRPAYENAFTMYGTVIEFSKDGFTALHFACYFGQPASARLLIESGAKIDIVANNPTQVMPLHSAASSRNLEAARSLVERGAPVNARQQAGWVPIHAAAQNGDMDMIELLLAHGADAEIANDEGKTPAMIAREKGHNEIAALLETAQSKI